MRFSWWKQGSNPHRWQSHVEWGDFLAVCSSVPTPPLFFGRLGLKWKDFLLFSLDPTICVGSIVEIKLGLKWFWQNVIRSKVEIEKNVYTGILSVNDNNPIGWWWNSAIGSRLELEIDFKVKIKNFCIKLDSNLNPTLIFFLNLFSRLDPSLFS